MVVVMNMFINVWELHSCRPDLFRLVSLFTIVLGHFSSSKETWSKTTSAPVMVKVSHMEDGTSPQNFPGINAMVDVQQYLAE